MSSLFTGLAPLERALDYHLERQNVLNSNVANINTPGFKSKDLVQAQEATGATLAMAKTSDAHLGPEGSNGQMHVTTDLTTPASLDGNNVSLEREMAKMMANSLRYDAATEVVSRRLAMLRYAASDGTST